MEKTHAGEGVLPKRFAGGRVCKRGTAAKQGSPSKPFVLQCTAQVGAGLCGFGKEHAWILDNWLRMPEHTLRSCSQSLTFRKIAAHPRTLAAIVRKLPEGDVSSFASELGAHKLTSPGRLGSPCTFNHVCDS